MTLGVVPPRQPGTTRADTRRFIRDLQLRCLAICAPLFVVIVLVGTPTWALLLAALGLGSLALDVAWLTIRIRRDRAPRR